MQIIRFRAWCAFTFGQKTFPGTGVKRSLAVKAVNDAPGGKDKRPTGTTHWCQALRGSGRGSSVFGGGLRDVLEAVK